VDRDGMRRMGAALSKILRGGVLLSAALVLLGLVLTAVTADTSSPYGSTELSWILGCDPFLAPSHVLFLGFFALVATPVVCVSASIIVFLRERDIRFTLIASLVLVILLVSFYLGIG